MNSESHWVLVFVLIHNGHCMLGFKVDIYGNDRSFCLLTQSWNLFPTLFWSFGLHLCICSLPVVIELFFFNPFRDATSAYRAEGLELQRQLRHLQSQFDMLTGQASALIQGRRARVAATSTVNGHLTTIDDSLSARNLEVCT